MFHVTIAPFQDDMQKQGHSLWPSIDVDPAMIIKIFTQNGQLLHKSMHFYDPRWDSRQKWSRCLRAIYDQSLWKVGALDPTRELEEIELDNIPQYNPYEDETQNE